VVERLGVNNFTQVLMQALMHERILRKDVISKKLMTFGANVVLFFKALNQVLFDKFLISGLHIPWGFTTGVATLTLGSQLKQRITTMRAKSEARESDFMFPRV
jgi:hypothetical protein